MIWDSSPWKRDIARRADALRRRKDQKRWSEASMARVEQDIFLSAFAVRKLIESLKISDEVESRSIRAKGYKRRSGAADVINWHRIDQLCELDNAGWRTVSLKDFCNQIIHSYMFVLEFEDSGELGGFFVASDQEKEQNLLFFEVDAVIKVLSAVAEDDIVSMSMMRADVAMSMKVIRKSSHHNSRT